jgi:hypothetical protein
MNFAEHLVWLKLFEILLSLKVFETSNKNRYFQVFGFPL